MIHYSRKQRHLKNLVKQTNGLLKQSDGIITKEIHRLKRKIQNFIDELSNVIPHITISKIIGSLFLILGLSINQVTAQEFATNSLNTFGIQNTNYSDLFTDFDFVDLDGDGDLDLVGSSKYYDLDDIEYYGSIVKYLENNGTPESANFLPAVAISENINWGFDNVYVEGYFSSINAVDIDGDGDVDLLVSIGGVLEAYDDEDDNNYLYAYNTVVYFENTGTESGHSFENAVINPFGIDLESIDYPGNPVVEFELRFITFTDIDNDGDLDLIGSIIDDIYIKGEGYTEVSRIYYCENSGNSTNPSFEEAEYDMWGLSEPLDWMTASITAVDLDLDGDMDLVTNQYVQNNYVLGDYCDYGSAVFYIENTGSLEEPNFNEEVISPFNLVSCQEMYLHNTKFADIDSDGDYDAFHLDLFYLAWDVDQSLVYYQENISPTGISFEAHNTNKKLIKTVDALGREVNHTTNQILFNIYDDGSVEKKFIVE